MSDACREALEFCLVQIRCYYDSAIEAIRQDQDPAPDIFDMAGFELAMQRAEAALAGQEVLPFRYGPCPKCGGHDWREVTDNNGTWGICNRCCPVEPAREAASVSR